MLADRGRRLTADEVRVLSACAAPMVAGLARRRQDERDAATAWHAADAHSRAALLAATGRQAREQLEKADTALAGLADPGAGAIADERAALVADARRAVAHVSRLIDDLRDLRRVQSGAVETHLRPVDLDEVLAAALEDLGPGGPGIT